MENQQTQLKYDPESGNRTRATFVVGESSHHCAIPAPLDKTQSLLNGTLSAFTYLFFNYFITYFLHLNCLSVCYFHFLIPLLVRVCFLSPSFSLFSLSFFHSLFQASSSSLFVFLSYAMFDFVWLSFFGRPYVLFLSILQTATLLVSIFDVEIFLGFWGTQFL